jgi:nitrite reductase (NADH) small subunit
MARLVKVAEVDELAPGQGKLVQVDGRDIALFNVNGAYYAMHGVCPHEEGPLNEGEVDGETIVCPWHGYDFSVQTGECSVDPELRVTTYAVRTAGNDVFIEVA